MSVKIRMKKMGRKHRPFFRICAIDSRQPRDGRVLEELGTYDPLVSDTDARVTLRADRVSYWIGKGAQPSDKVRIFIKKYGLEGTRLSEQQQARERLAMPKIVPPPPEPVYVPQVKQAPAEAAPAESMPESMPESAAAVSDATVVTAEPAATTPSATAEAAESATQSSPEDQSSEVQAP